MLEETGGRGGDKIHPRGTHHVPVARDFGSVQATVNPALRKGAQLQAGLLSNFWKIDKSFIFKVYFGLIICYKCVQYFDKINSIFFKQVQHSTFQMLKL